MMLDIVHFLMSIWYRRYFCRQICSDVQVTLGTLYLQKYCSNLACFPSQQK